MRNVRDNKGITLIVLIITIIVLLIIAGISISGGIQGIEQVDDNRLVSELEKVQHAVTQRYSKYELTKDKSLIVGTKVDTLPTLPTPTGATEPIKWKVFQATTGETVSPHPERKYYRLSKSDLEELGLTGDYKGSSYVVNYYSGEVYDENQKQTSSGTILYKSAIENEASELGDEIIQNGLQVWYDAINNTGSGHSSTTTTWKDLSGNGNDAQLNGFNGTATSGWNSNYLAFDGSNDWAKTVKEVDYKDSEALTIEVIDINGALAENDTTAMLVESSPNWNNYNNTFGVDTNEGTYKGDLRFTFHLNQYNYNIKGTGNIFDNNYLNIYTIVFNMNNEYNNFISIYKNGNVINVLSAVRNYDISNNSILNYVLYIGCRGEKKFFTKMNLADFKIYNNALTEAEVKHNYILEKNRYGIEE